MEEEAEKIRQMQNEVEKQMNRSTSSTLSKCSSISFLLVFNQLSGAASICVEPTYFILLYCS